MVNERNRASYVNDSRARILLRRASAKEKLSIHNRSMPNHIRSREHTMGHHRLQPRIRNKHIRNNRRPITGRLKQHRRIHCQPSPRPRDSRTTVFRVST